MAVLTVVNIMGTAIGFLIPPLFVSNPTNTKQVQSDFFLLLIFEFVLAGISLFLNAVFFK